MWLENNLSICLIWTENKITITVIISIYFLSPIAGLAKVNTEVNTELSLFNALEKARTLNFPLSRTFLLVPWEFDMADVHPVYFKCSNIIVSYTAKIQWRQSGNLANILKMSVNRVPWSLLKKVPQAPKCLEYPSASSAWLPWVPRVP